MSTFPTNSSFIAPPSVQSRPSVYWYWGVRVCKSCVQFGSGYWKGGLEWFHCSRCTELAWHWQWDRSILVWGASCLRKSQPDFST